MLTAIYSGQPMVFSILNYGFLQFFEFFLGLSFLLEIVDIIINQNYSLFFQILVLGEFFELDLMFL